jgi:site-specific recombinase XerD
MVDIFGKNPLRSINKADIKKVISSIAKSSSKLNANKYLAAIKKVFKLGLELNAVAEDITAGIKAYSEKDHERNRFLYPHELDRLVKKTQLTRAKFYMPAIIFLGAEHGASKQEILSLKWTDIQFNFGDTGLITFYRTKNKRQRTEYLMPRTRKALLDWKKHLEYTRKRGGIRRPKSDYVFCRIDGTPIKNFNNAWWAARNRAGIYDFHFHDLRHTFCSNLIMSGADLKDAKEMIGHADIAMTDRYAHLSGIYKQGLQRKLAEHYGNPHAD